MAADLSARDIEKGKFAFEVYDFDGSGKIDAYFVGDVLRGLNLNPTLEIIEKMGGTKKKNEKTLTVEEFLPIYGQVKKEKESGTYEDFNECMKLYDKTGNNTMLKAELDHILLSLGEKLDKSQVESIMADICPPEDEDGFIQFVPLLKKLIAGPFPEEK